MCSMKWFGTAALVMLLGAGAACGADDPPAAAPDERALREYAGVYRWGPDAFVYLQLWNELAGKNHLVSFDESGEVRTLYPAARDRFVTGPAAAVAEPVESRIVFDRDGDGRILSFTMKRAGAPARVSRRVETERHETVRFSNGNVRLEGTLIDPAAEGRHPAVILVHGSGPLGREWTLPFARFLVRRGMAVLAYDKRGVGGSSGKWETASFDDLAGDAVAAFEYLKTRDDIDARQIGLMGVSQAGWVMPLAANRAPGIAFLISVSGAGVTPAETTLDQARNEMTARGMKAETVSAILDLMKLQYHFAETGEGWEEYAAARQELAERIGAPPDSFPAAKDHPSWEMMRRLYFHDPAPALRRLRVPTLALFGELDNNIVAEKNRAAWAAALESGEHPDYTLRILPRANHLQLEAKVGSSAEMASLQRFVPAYFATIEAWLAKRVGGFPRR